MANAIEVAGYLFHLASQEPEAEPVTQLRLHKLLYYVQGWSLALRDTPFFASEIEAWAHGPVVRDLYPKFADYGNQPIPAERAMPSVLRPDERDFVRSIWESYKVYSATKLRNMTHREPPYRAARGDLGPDEPCEHEISKESMAEFFRAEYEAHAIPGLDLKSLHAADTDFASGEAVDLEDLLTRLGT